jgi:hypothetical protein
MNAIKFKRSVLFVIFIYCFAIVFGIVLKIYDTSKGEVIYTTFKDLIPLIIAIPAAWLGFCFQRRQVYLKDVREIWSKLVVTFQDVMQYNYLEKPTQSDYGQVLKQLSIIIDELRAIFSNLGENSKNIGLYPFESIKGIFSEISSLEYGEKYKSDEVLLVRERILKHWKQLRKYYLYELERGLPENIDSPYIR